jgi:hypothetical protein
VACKPGSMSGKEHEVCGGAGGGGLKGCLLTVCSHAGQCQREWLLPFVERGSTFGGVGGGGG